MPEGPAQRSGAGHELRRVPADLRRSLVGVNALLLRAAVFRTRWTRSADRARRKCRPAAHPRPAGGRRHARARWRLPRNPRVPARLRRLRRHQSTGFGSLQPRRAARAIAGVRAGRSAGDLPASVGACGLGTRSGPHAGRIETGAPHGASAAPAPGHLARTGSAFGHRLRAVQQGWRRRPRSFRVRPDRFGGRAHRPVRAAGRTSLQFSVHLPRPPPTAISA